VPQFFGGGRTYEKCTKITVETFMSDPMYYLQYGIGFTDSIMDAIDEAVQKSANRQGSINLNNVIKSFGVDSAGDNLNIVLSSLFLNKQRKNPFPFVDKIFTVYTPDHIETESIDINCGARNCFDCGLCYEKNGVEVINEKLK
jgi:hypothetical protein